MSTIDRNPSQPTQPVSTTAATPIAVKVPEGAITGKGVRSLRRGDSPIKRFFIHATLWVACFIAIYPISRIFTVSLSRNTLQLTSLSVIPANPTWDNYIQVLCCKGFPLWLWNSLVVSLTTATIGLVLASTGAYAFSRFKFPGRASGLIFLLATQMLPAGMTLLPMYILLIRLHLIGSYIGLITAYSITTVPFSIWILKGYYDTIPVDLEEASQIDGANVVETFWRIIVPLSAPAYAIAFLFNFLAGWSEVIVARIVLQGTEALQTWPVGLFKFSGQFSTEWGYYSASSILVAIPVMALFLYSAKWLVSGLTLGSVKG